MTNPQKLTLGTIFAVTLMTAVGTSTMPPALAAVEQQFDVTPNISGQLLALFTLPGLLLAPLLGVAADRVGRKKILIPSLLLFALGGGLAYLATSFEELRWIRLLQGIGAASLGALNVTLIGDYFEGNRRTAIMGYNNSILSVGTAIFPLIGAALAATSWKLPFTLPLLGIFVAILVLVFVQEQAKEAEPQSLPEFLRSSVLALRSPLIVILLIVSAITFAILFGPFLNYLQVKIKSVVAEDPATILKRIGLMASTMSVATAFAALFLGRLSTRFGQRRLLVFSGILYAVASALFFLMPSYGLLFIPTVTFGFAQALNQPNVQAMVAGFAPPRHRAVFMSLNRSVALLGQTTGPILFGVLYANFGGLGAVFFGSAMLAGVLTVIVEKRTEW